MRRQASSPRSVKGANSYQVGDRVTFDSTVYCGACEFCRRGEVNLCDHRQVVGVSCGDYRRAGAFAEYVTVPERILYRLPDNLSFADAAMLEAVSVAIHAVRVAEVKGGETALVIGAGMIGLLIQQAARASGCSRIFVTDLDATRLELARSLGADAVIDGSRESLASRIEQLTGAVALTWSLKLSDVPRRSRPPSTARARAAQSRWSATSRLRSPSRCRKW